MRSLYLRGRTCKRQLICISLRFSSNHSSFSSVPSGPPVIVGMSINIASIDSISEVNMVRYTLLFFHLLVPAKVCAPYPRSAGQCWRCCPLCCFKKSLLWNAGASNLFHVPAHLQARTQSTSASTNARFPTRFPSTISASRHHWPE